MVYQERPDFYVAFAMIFAALTFMFGEYAFLEINLHSRLRVFVNLNLALKTRLEVHLLLNFIS